MSVEQPRIREGSPGGGQFASWNRAEASTNLGAEKPVEVTAAGAKVIEAQFILDDAVAAAAKAREALDADRRDSGDGPLAWNVKQADTAVRAARRAHGAARANVLRAEVAHQHPAAEELIVIVNGSPDGGWSLWAEITGPDDEVLEVITELDGDVFDDSLLGAFEQELLPGKDEDVLLSLRIR